VGGQLVPSFGALPLAFEQNVGQTDGSVQFLARAQGYQAFLQPDRAVLVLAPTPQARAENPSAPLSDVVGLQFVGANPNSVAQGVNELPGRSNYFTSHDSSGWVSNVPNYSSVVYRDLYPGIDLVYQADPQHPRDLEYNFVVRPGADLSAIRLNFQGVSSVGSNPDGSLSLTTAHGGTLTDHRPSAAATCWAATSRSASSPAPTTQPCRSPSIRRSRTPATWAAPAPTPPPPSRPIYKAIPTS
jgi:hypothetical protein